MTMRHLLRMLAPGTWLLAIAMLGLSALGQTARADVAPGAATAVPSLEDQLMADDYTHVATRRGLHVDVMVMEGQTFRCMTFDRRNLFQSCMHKAQPMQLALEYTRGLLAGLRFLPEPPRRILLVGLGGGSIPKVIMAHFPHTALDVVELDAAVVQVARTWFDFQPNGQVAVHAMDARVFVRQKIRQGQHYDLILLDAFDHDYVPEHLLTVEFLQQVRQLLAPGGVVAANTFSRGRLQPHEEATWQAVFPHLLRAQRRMNDILYAAPHALHANTDDPLLDALTGPWPHYQPVPVPPSHARALTDQWSPTNILRQAD